MSKTRQQRPTAFLQYASGRLTPEVGSEEEKQMFHYLQQEFAGQYEHAFPNEMIHKTVVIIPSLTLDQEILRKIDGVSHYEERMLCMLMLLRMPRTHVVFVTSMPVDPIVIDYYLHLLPGITGYHARQRLTLLSCYDDSPLSLTEKILARPRLIKRIRQSVPSGHITHMSCFNVTEYERTLAVRLHMPIFGCDPDLYYLGSKSEGRRLFRDNGLQVPDGFENLMTTMDVAEALAALKVQHPKLSRAVVKMNEGFSGEGNAIFHYSTEPDFPHYDPARILQVMPKQLIPVATDITYPQFMHKFETMGGIAEIYVEGAVKTSPSVQCRINPLGRCEVISTHDQVLGGEDLQVFLGANFPANPEYASALGEMIVPLCNDLRKRGVLGRFAIDFLSVKEGDTWKHYAIEINLRKGGTTHPFLMLMFLTDGNYDAATGTYKMKNGQPRFYFTTDNLMDKSFRGLTPHDLIEIAMENKIMFNGSTQCGVMFHIITALSQFGKLGVLCIGNTPEEAQRYYEQTLLTLKAACRAEMR